MQAFDLFAERVEFGVLLGPEGVEGGEVVFFAFEKRLERGGAGGGVGWSGGEGGGGA